MGSRPRAAPGAHAVACGARFCPERARAAVPRGLARRHAAQSCLATVRLALYAPVHFPISWRHCTGARLCPAPASTSCGSATPKKNANCLAVRHARRAPRPCVVVVPTRGMRRSQVVLSRPRSPPKRLVGDKRVHPPTRPSSPRAIHPAVGMHAGPVEWRRARGELGAQGSSAVADAGRTACQQDDDKRPEVPRFVLCNHTACMYLRLVRCRPPRARRRLQRRRP